MRRILMCLLVIVTAPQVWAADPQELTPLTQPQALPTPTIVGSAAMPLEVGFVRTNRWDVWQNYAVDRAGHWRPRVALGAPEPFYLFNGAPFTRLPVLPRVFLPYILD